MNKRLLQEIVRGNYGRKVAYANVDEITEENIVKVLGRCISVFNYNRPIFKYLYEYFKGDQPILYREKVVRDDIVNKVVVNRAYEIVAFKNAQTNGEPIQCVSLSKDDRVNQGVDRYNDYCRSVNKQAVDIECGDWVSATGTGFKAVQRTNGEIPFRLITPTPMDTFIIYSKHTKEPLLAVQQLEDENNHSYYLCFSDKNEYTIQNSHLVPYEVYNDGYAVYSRPHAFGGIPIIEYPNNPQRLSDIEIVIDILDAISKTQSDRIDSVDQFVQSWIKFVNCEIDEETFKKMKTMGALVVKSNSSDGKADVDVMSQELNQSQTQTFKDDLWDDALSILGIPNKQNNNTGGDTQGAVELRNGWDFSKQRAKLKDPLTIQAEKRLATVILNIIRQEKGANECPFNIMDYDVQISHSPTDNMQVKAQVLQMLLSAGIHPLIAIKVCGLWSDAEKVFLMSKPFLDAIYKTIDEIDNAAEQEATAQQLVEQFNQANNQKAVAE